MENAPLTQRVCSECGFSKPFSAFLYISSTRGTILGAICATCRSTRIARGKKPPGQEEDSGSTRSDARIGAREKAYREKEWERKLEEKKQEHREQRKEDEQRREQKFEKTEKRQEETKRRNAQSSPWEHKPKTTPTAIFTRDRSPESRKTVAGDTETRIQEKIEKDQKEQRLGGALVNIDPQQATVARTSAAHLSFLGFLGTSSPAGLANARTQEKKIASAESDAGHKAEQPGFRKKK